jgi:hypothetical protein
VRYLAPPSDQAQGGEAPIAALVFPRPIAGGPGALAPLPAGDLLGRLLKAGLDVLAPDGPDARALVAALARLPAWELTVSEPQVAAASLRALLQD